MGLGDLVTQVPPFPAKLREDNVRTGFVEGADYDKLAAACSREGTWMRAIFEAGYSLGWRVEELQSRRAKHVDLENRTIRLEPGETKNGRGRTAPLFAQLYPWIQQAMHEKESDDYLFSRDSLGVRPVRDFRGSWYKVCCAAGLGQMHCKTCDTVIAKGKCPEHGQRTLKQQTYSGLIFHDLRRTAIRGMTRAGIPQAIAMKISGHETDSVFRRYDIVSESDLELARERMTGNTHPNPQAPKIAPETVQQQTPLPSGLPN